MLISIVTLFPELFEPFLRTSMVGRAVKSGALIVELIDLRAFGLGKHRNVDDTPYGGGSGMVLRVEPIVAALEHIDDRARERGQAPAKRVLLTPQGARLVQATARGLVGDAHLALVCGRYEGFDERVRSFVELELSLGDFVMTGGEVAAMALIEATSRLLPGVLGNDGSALSESYAPTLAGGLEYPQYTRPIEFRGLGVPEVLTSGNHAEVEAYRLRESQNRTLARRPDLLVGGERKP